MKKSINTIVQETIDLSKEIEDIDVNASLKVINIGSDMQDYSENVSEACKKLLEENKKLLIIMSGLVESSDPITKLYYKTINDIVKTNGDIIEKLLK